MQMTRTFEETGKLGKEFVDSTLDSLVAVSKDAQAVSAEASTYAKSVFDSGSAAMQKLLSAKSLEKALDIQTAFLKQAYEGFLAEATKMSDLYADMAKDACRPFKAIVVRSK
jgi:hypothetical protein